MFTCIGCTLILLFPQLHLSAPKDAPVQLPGAMMAQLEEQFRDFDSGAKEFRVVDWRILDTGDAVIVATATLDHDGKGAVGLLLAGKAPKGGMFAIDLFKVADRHQNQYAIDCCSPGRVTLRERTSVYCLPQAKHMYFYDAPQKKVLGKQAVDFLSIDFLAVQGHTLYAAGKRVGKPSDTSKPEVPVIVEVVPAEKGPGIASWKIISSVDGVPLSPLRRSPGEEGMVIFAGDRQEYVLNGDTWKARPVRGAMRNMAAYGNERFLVTGEDGYDPAVLPESLRAALKAPANAHGVAVFSEHGAKGAEFYAIPEIEPSHFLESRPEMPERLPLGQFKLSNGIGAFQLVGKEILFGLSFYDGEGYSGVGGIGHFDLETKVYRFDYPKELLSWSTGALLAEEGVLWLGLKRCPEGYPDSGGLARYDLSTGAIRKFAVPHVIRAICRLGTALFLGTDDGIYVLQGETVTRIHLSITPDGQDDLIVTPE